MKFDNTAISPWINSSIVEQSGQLPFTRFSYSSGDVNDQTLQQRLSRNADQCVKCGLCLPHCPTYRVQQDEAESPRGRISLIQGLAENELRESPRLAAHLSSCLECRACETACPSLVKFAALMDDARALRVRRLSPWVKSLRSARLHVMSSGWGVRASVAVSRLYRFVGLGLLMERADLPPESRLRAHHRVAMQLDKPAAAPTASPPNQMKEGNLALFLGCVARAAQPGLAAAARRVLERLEYRVRIPAGQRCCGAMHRHSGFPEVADHLLRQNSAAFTKLQPIATASACAAELRAHPGMNGAAEICRFLADLEWPPDAILRPLSAPVAVHEPCSHRNILRDGAAAYDLLRRIPRIEAVPLEDNAFCCGAAGTYLLDQPAMSAALLAPKIEHLKQLGTGILVTTNTGCALHLAAGAREAGLALEVLHPVELIARQLAD